MMHVGFEDSYLDFVFFDIFFLDFEADFLSSVAIKFTKGIKNITSMVKDEGRIYIKMPCKHALFAKLNLILPNKITNKIMPYFFPSKKNLSGFPAFYDKATPIEIIKIFKKEGFLLEEYNYVKWSTYFTFLFPLYFVWRIITLLQNLILKDYCESFEMIFYKN